MFFEDTIDDSKFSGHLYGLGTSFSLNGSSNYAIDNGENSTLTTWKYKTELQILPN